MGISRSYGPLTDMLAHSIMIDAHLIVNLPIKFL